MEGINRRSFLTAGAAAIGSVALPESECLAGKRAIGINALQYGASLIPKIIEMYIHKQVIRFCFHSLLNVSAGNRNFDISQISVEGLTLSPDDTIPYTALRPIDLIQDYVAEKNHINIQTPLGVIRISRKYFAGLMGHLATTDEEEVIAKIPICTKLNWSGWSAHKAAVIAAKAAGEDVPSDLPTSASLSFVQK